MSNGDLGHGPMYSQELRLVIGEQDSRLPAETAFFLGRACNEVRFLAESAWLSQLQDADRFDQLWSFVRILCREALGATRIDIQERISEARQDWFDTFRSEYFSEWVWSVNQVIRNAREHGQELPAQSETEFLCESSRQGSIQVQLLFQHLRSLLEAERQQIFDLGVHFDSAFRPVLSHNVVRFPRDESADVSSGWNVPNPPPQAYTWVLPRQPPIVLSNWPDNDWRLQFNHMLHLCGLSELAVSREIPEGLNVLSVLDATVVSVMRRLSQATNCADVNEVADTGSAQPESESGSELDASQGPDVSSTGNLARPHWYHDEPPPVGSRFRFEVDGSYLKRDLVSWLQISSKTLEKRVRENRVWVYKTMGSLFRISFLSDEQRAEFNAERIRQQQRENSQ